MVLEQKVDVKQKIGKELLPNWYRSSDRAKHPHPKKLKVECSLDEDVIRWLEKKTIDDEEYPIYINYYLRKIMDNDINI
ncbi:MAG: hypothetical protein LBU83_07885 [Bacteroidales bacterium]|jgi:hypothetical protein|nr:hypothetical protein [Bacteroidales bacterium]